MTFSSKEFDEFLSENCVKPRYIYVHPLIWNGYWSFKYKPKDLFRWIGRKLHNKYIYWIGFPLYWVEGIKTYSPFGEE